LPVTQEDKLGVTEQATGGLYRSTGTICVCMVPWSVRRYPHQIRALDPSSIFYLRISTNSKCRATHISSMLCAAAAHDVTTAHDSWAQTMTS
jgi:hypothetical protein